MIDFVNAKINLGLNVVRKREDGYHDLHTVFLPVGKRSGLPGQPGGLCDLLEITPAAQDEFVMIGAAFDCAREKNLAWRAVLAWREAAGNNEPVAVRLQKYLPSGAGMGGGSADAAFALLLMNKLHGNLLPMSKLHELATRLGADVPFFLYNEPALAEGIGEKLSPVRIDQLQGKWVGIVKPEQGISTAEAFSNIVPAPAPVSLPEALKRPIGEWCNLIVNDFEKAMFKLHSHLAALKELLYAKGALYASMTGSGSAFYGIFSSREQAERAVQAAGTNYTAIAAF